MTLRLYCGQRGGRRTKSHRIKFEIQEINYQKSICMQQNAINFVENNWVEKKVPHNFLKWAFVVPLVLPQKSAYSIKTQRDLSISTILWQPFKNEVTCSFIRLLHAQAKWLGWPTIWYLKFTSLDFDTLHKNVIMYVIMWLKHCMHMLFGNYISIVIDGYTMHFDIY